MNWRSALLPPASSVAVAASMAICAGGLVSISCARACWAARLFSQNVPPMPMVAATWASKMHRKNFQNRRPTLIP